jgi:hypothetical protein
LWACKGLRLCGCHLLRQFRAERLLALSHITLVAIGINKWIWATLFHLCELRFHPVVISVGAQKYVARKRFQDAEHALVVGGNLRIERVVDELVAGVHVGASDDDHIVRLAAFFRLHRPRGRALGVPGGEVRGEDGVPEPDLVAIVEDAVHFCGLVEGSCGIAVLEIPLPAGFDFGHVRIHHHILRTSQLLDGSTTRAVIPMRVADQENLDVAEVKAQLFDTVSYQRDRACKTAVDQNVALRRRDQVGGQALAPDVVDIANDSVGREGIRPVGARLRERASCGHQHDDHCA